MRFRDLERRRRASVPALDLGPAAAATNGTCAASIRTRSGSQTGRTACRCV